MNKTRRNKKRRRRNLEQRMVIYVSKQRGLQRGDVVTLIGAFNSLECIVRATARSTDALARECKRLDLPAEVG